MFPFRAGRKIVRVTVERLHGPHDSSQVDPSRLGRGHFWVIPFPVGKGLGSVIGADHEARRILTVALDSSTPDPQQPLSRTRHAAEWRKATGRHMPSRAQIAGGLDRMNGTRSFSGGRLVIGRHRRCRGLYMIATTFGRLP